MSIHINKNGKKLGPYPLEEVNKQINSGKLKAVDLAWHEGLPDWLPLCHIKGVELKIPPTSPPSIKSRNRASVAMPRLHGIEYVQATRGQRFLNSIIDNIFLYFPMKICAFVALANGASFQLTFLINLAIILGYYTFLESSNGKTIGKALTKTKVITESGKTPDFSTAAKRSLCRFIPFEAFSFLGDDVRGWHDSISKTYVVKNK